MTDSERGALAQYKLANLWQRRGEPARALEGYARAIALDPRCVPAQLERGDLLLRQGQRTAAVDAYQRGLEANPHNASIATHLAHARAPETDVTAEPYFIARASPTADGRNGILLISDFGGIYGVGQFNQLLLDGFKHAGYVWVDAPQPISTWLAQRNAEPAPNALEQVLNETDPARVVFSDGSPLSNLNAKQMVARRVLPFVCIVHQTGIQNAGVEERARAAESYRSARAVLAASCANLDALRREFDLPATQGRVIYHGCPAIFFAPRDEMGRQRIRAALEIPDGALLMFTAARMELEKGYQYQLGALKRLRASPLWARLYVVWAGSGTAESQLLAEVMEQDLREHVRFLGERTDIPALLDASDLFILTSEQEGIPRAMMEAMAKELPVAATKVDGVPEALGDAGQLLADPRVEPEATIRELTETLERWGADAGERVRVGRAGRERALELFTPERMQREFVAAIEEARE